MTTADQILLALLIVVACSLSYSFGYSAALRELKGRVDALAKLLRERDETKRDRR